MFSGKSASGHFVFLGWPSQDRHRVGLRGRYGRQRRGRREDHEEERLHQESGCSRVGTRTGTQSGETIEKSQGVLEVLLPNFGWLDKK
jgi:hypothetical protein